MCFKHQNIIKVLHLGGKLKPQFHHTGTWAEVLKHVLNAAVFINTCYRTPAERCAAVVPELELIMN